MIRLKTLLLALLPILAVFTIGLFHHSVTYAATSTHSDLIDDRIFDNYNSMSANGIDVWLDNNFGSTSCISTDRGFSAPDPTGYNPSQGFLYGGNVSAGQVIFDAAQAYSVNPQVILATLQKESSVVSGTASYGCQYINTAMGYDCPDSGSCPGNPATESGFSKQVIHAAWLFSFGRQRSEGNTSWNVQKPGWNNSDDPNTCYRGPMTTGSFKQCSSDASPVSYDGYTTIDGTSTHMDTGATAAFYWYTPHFAGNDNFDAIFTNWFGSPVGPDYAWAIAPANFSYNPTMAIGTTQQVVLSATNTGRLPWYNSKANTPYPIRLGTWLPGRQSPFRASGWIGPDSTRPAELDQNVVQPGQTGTFTFNLTAPTTAGSYSEDLNIVMENYQWLPSVGFRPTINVVNPYSWQLNSVNYSTGTGYMAPGSTQQIIVSAKNTGTATWSNTGSVPIRLGTWQPGRQSPVASGWIDSTRPVAVVGPGGASTVAPNQVGTFTFNVYMPDGGQHYERFNVLAEGITWFNDPGLTLYLQGQSYAWQPLWFSPSTGTWTMSPGQHFILTMQAKNTGSTTWYKDGQGSFPVHLATNGPQNRGSALYTPSWLSSIRPTGLVQNSVPPGGEGTFTFNAVAPSVTGARFEAFNLVAEGIAWFNDPGFGFTINVQ